MVFMTTTTNKMTEAQYSNYTNGLRIQRLIPMIERSADVWEAQRSVQPDSALVAGEADEAWEALARLDDELKALGWLRGPCGWVYPPRESLS